VINMRSAGPGLALFAALLASGCSSSGDPSGHACPDIALLAPQLLYPIPGSTGVPTAAGSLLVAGNVPSTVVAELVPATGTILNLGTLGPPPSPLPSPAATPISSLGTLQGVAYPALSAATSYSVDYQDTATPCPVAITGNSASFTTR
jgi:hypothetical protein